MLAGTSPVSGWLSASVKTGGGPPAATRPTALRVSGPMTSETPRCFNSSYSARSIAASSSISMISSDTLSPSRACAARTPAISACAARR